MITGTALALLLADMTVRFALSGGVTRDLPPGWHLQAHWRDAGGTVAVVSLDRRALRCRLRECRGGTLIVREPPPSLVVVPPMLGRPPAPPPPDPPPPAGWVVDARGRTVCRFIVEDGGGPLCGER